MKTKIFATLATVIALVVGGLVTSAPAHAVGGSTIHYAGQGPDVPNTIQLRNRGTGGDRYLQPFGSKRHNVARTCAPSDRWRFIYASPRNPDVWYDLGPGGCLEPGLIGIYQVVLKVA